MLQLRNFQENLWDDMHTKHHHKMKWKCCIYICVRQQWSINRRTHSVMQNRNLHGCKLEKSTSHSFCLVWWSLVPLQWIHESSKHVLISVKYYINL